VQRHYEDFRRRAEVLVVTPSRPEALAAFLAESAYPFPVVADPAREAYRTFGLGRTSWWRLFSPGVVWRYLRLMWGGAARRYGGPRRARTCSS
jgi:AhpC/TSA antioxidant enzyme